ncbi:polysaccharide deacetylase family protein [Hyphomicrobium sp.]|uniref:polysaccharide deacetylase family protein n=2 Tax=Hyphomicrobium sp. TaxID=82 RepID=UPI002C8A6462|nr:polysaccharide deacetylase family protein [Hyphomicrobium sp.]HRQ26548.1 polysaccharide deacetylase family protein [Hyphomicrobium sp.]
MRRFSRHAIVVFAGLAMWNAPASATECKDPAKALGVSRIVEIDTTNGAMFGAITKRDAEDRFLAEDEVVLTFDDGPVPWVTGPILDTLDAFCTKATFFPVGRMAINRPALVKDILARGHTIGGHTWSHPNNLRRLSHEKAIDQIERGFAAVALAAGTDIAPFFRFPGLNDSDELLDYLQGRNIASFTVDVISNDSFISNPKAIADRTLRLATSQRGGILLFHDLKRPTARALPAILAGLKARGFKVVHIVPKAPAKPLATLDAELQPILAKAKPSALVPIYGSPAQARTREGERPEITTLAPEPRSRSRETQASAADASATGQP